MFFFGFFVKIVGNSGSGRFVDDMEYFKISNGIGIFSGEMLRVVEVGRDVFIMLVLII